MKKFLVSLLLLMAANSIAQEESYAEQFSKSVQVPNSPEAEAFSKYGEVDANLFTGTPNISVPLYTIKGKEMDLPISLTYDASGIKVRDVASNVGLGWNLNVGGRVSRQTRGLPDHGDVQSGSLGTLADSGIRADLVNYMSIELIGTGLYDATTALGDSNFNVAIDNIAEYYRFLQDVQKGKIDIEQDYFSLNIMGLNETIWMDTEDYAPVPLDDPNLKIVSPTSPATDPLYWEVVDTNGNTYYFGKYIDGDEPYPVSTSNPIERVHRWSDDDTQSGSILDMEYNSSWLITKIVSANGKDVYHFEYTDFEDYSNPETPELVNQSTFHGLALLSGGATQYSGAGSLPPANKITDVMSSYTQQYVKAIYHNGRKVVVFSQGDRDDLEDGEDKKITGFDVYDDADASGAQPIKQVSFEQSYFGDTDAPEYHKVRLKLDEVFVGNGNAENYFSFEYYAPDNVPDRFSSSMDYMGYYNGKQNPTAFREWPQTGTVVLPGANRDVVPNATKVGILEKLIYPTGGFTEFTYENHNDGTDDYPGLRIKKIKNYTDVGVLASEKKYEYPGFSENYVPILDIETLKQMSPCANNYPTQPKTLTRYVTAPNMDGGPHISYSEVHEIAHDGQQANGVTKYFFEVDADAWDASNTPPFEKHYRANTLAGKPAGNEVRDTSDNKVSESTTTYFSPIAGYSDTAVTLFTDPMRSFAFVQAYIDSGVLKIYTGQGDGDDEDGGAWCGSLTCLTCGPGGTPLGGSNIFQMNPAYCSGTHTYEHCWSTQRWAAMQLKTIDIDAYRVNPQVTTTYEYFTNGTVETDTENEYSTDGLFLMATEKEISGGDIIRTEYTYPMDIPGGSITSAEQELIDRNMLYVPIVTKTKKGSTLLSTKRTGYGLFSFPNNVEFVLPKSLQFEKGGTGSNLEDRIVYSEYDGNGNLTEAKLEDGTPTSYVWGYGGRYPVAKVENATYAEATDSGLGLNMSVIDNPTSESALMTELQKIRDGLSDALVTSYTYIPLVGVSTITDPSGNTIHYEYDSENRLEYVLDRDQKVVGENKYHFRSKSAISGVEITVTNQTTTYIDYGLDVSAIDPGGLSLEYLWTTENGTISGLNDNNTFRVNYNCTTLDSQPLEVSCLVMDGSEVYSPQKVSNLTIPDGCTMTGDIVADDHGSYVIFSVQNIQGGTGSPQYDWDLVSTDPAHTINGSTTGSTFRVDYTSCDQLIENVKVSCVISSNGAEGTLYGHKPVCSIYWVPATNDNISWDVDFGAKMMEFSAPTLYGGHPDGFTYIWSFDDPDCGLLEKEVQGINFPFNDGQGNYYWTYQCAYDCNGGAMSGNFPLDVYLTVYHSNGGVAELHWESGLQYLYYSCTAP